MPEPRRKHSSLSRASHSRYSSNNRSKHAKQDDDQAYESQGYVGYSLENRKRKTNPGFAILKVAIALIVLVAAVFGVYKLVQTLATTDLGASSGEEVSVYIPEGSTTSEIATILKTNDVIASKDKFIKAVRDAGVESQLLPGKYTLTTGMSNEDVIKALIAGANLSGQGNKLTIPEGFTIESTAARVEEVCGIPAADFIAEAHLADKYVADFPFLEGVYNNSLEGFLYPKTYMIPEGSDAEYVIRVLLEQFDLEMDLAGIDLTAAAEKNLNLYDLVIIASMIEKEVLVEAERPLVSSVIYNRLHEGMRLQICATVVYAMGLESYDGHPLLETDLETDSPYNTYLVDSLPAGPICSPRIESIAAAAAPASTDYFYYVLTSEEGTHTFCATYEEFEEANALYHELFNVPN
jgi:UPF0755 protein